MAGPGQALVLPVLLCCLCPGAASIECKGRVWIEPAPVVRMGSDISIGCQSWLGCPSAQLLILLNYSLAEGTPLALPGGAVRLRLRRFQMPFATVTCFSRCARRDRLVCGAELRAGYPPDPPGNLSCAIAEGSERLECGWDGGRLTHLPTRNSLHLRRVLAQDEEDEEEKVFPADSPVLLRELHNDSHYSAWVQASNVLGTARSAPRHLSLQELVVPALPEVIGAETTETSPASTTTRWRSRSQLRNVHCEERHRATGTPTWHVEPCDTVALEGPSWRHELQSDTEFVFQARCRLGTAHSPWSAWSPPFLYRTPEAAPAAAPAVWRRLGPALPNGSHEVTVLIKPLAARDARGRILGYAVSAESPAGARLLCRTAGTECTVLVPPGARRLLVTARNSKGASSPASIPLSRAAAQEEFPAPEAVEVKAEQQSRFLVQWRPPRQSRSPLLWFILEWGSSSQHGQQEQYSWERVPHQETHTYIQGPAAGAAPRVRLFAVYPGGISAPGSSPAPAEEPLLGSAYSEMPQDGDIRVFLGLSLSVVGLSVLFAIVMFKKSVRKRIKATLVSLLPKWLFEDFPHMENSSVVKSLQDKADFPGDSLQEPFLAPADPAVTQVEEVPAQERHQSLDTKARAEVPEPRELPRTPSTPAPGQLGAYKPQLSDRNALGYVAAGIYRAQPPAAVPQPEVGIFSRDYTSPVPQLWDQQGGTPQVCLLEKINLVLNSSLEFPGQAGHGSVPEQRWEPPGDGPQQMLVPEELLSCLRATNRESVDANPHRAWEGCPERSWNWG
ncbi:interleukin-23 receptor [Vidua macroura]|uniref:interleukin-23 receptor n=1 Tax=Vidua macroura TaxID=187451 RepID=UPI0023A8D04C|nr:interleukin-23 receptor [Vidua macroura]